jgi:hypothetical protein
MALALRVVWSETMSAQQRASLTRDGKWGPALWLGDRCVARIYATVEDSRITPEEPEPRWLRDAMVFVNAVNGRQIDVEALADAVCYVYGNVTRHGASIGPDRPGPREGYRKRSFWVEDARLIAAEYAALTRQPEGQ